MTVTEPRASRPSSGELTIGPVPVAATRDRPLAWRLGAVLLCGVLAQALVAPRLAPPGAAPDLLLVATVAVAAAVPSRSAVIFGFGAGLAADLFLVTPFGLSAAAFIACARAGCAFPGPRRALLIGPRAALSALLAGALVTFGAAALGEGPGPSSTGLGLLLRASATAGALAPAVFAALRRLLAPRRPA